MKTMIKRIMATLAMGVYFGVAGIMLITLVVGAFQWAAQIVSNQEITDLQWLCAVFVFLVCGIIGAVIWYTECAEEDEKHDN